MRILTLTRYERLGSSSRVRFYQYFPNLKSQGVDIYNAPFFDDEYVRNLYVGNPASFPRILQAYINRVIILTRKNNIDLLWVEKEFLPWLPIGIESVFGVFRIPYVVDYDDAVFHRYEYHQSGIIRRFLGKKIDKVMRYSSLVITGNEYLAERALQAGARRVEILPSVVDVDRYTIKETQQGLNIGWIGSPATSSFLTLLNLVLRRVLDNSPGVQLTLIGAGKIDPLPGINKKILPWNEETEIKDLQTFDVGIMPLPDEPFERGKCGYKLIQYMASGLPVIASPIGVNKKIVDHGINGFLASTDEQWFNALIELSKHVDRRKQMGFAGRKKTEKNYNLQVTAPRLFELLKSVVEQSL